MSNTIYVQSLIQLQRPTSLASDLILLRTGVGLTQLGEGRASGPQLIATTATDLNLSNITTEYGYGWFENQSATDDVELGWTDGTPAWVPVLLLRAGMVYPGINLCTVGGRTWQLKSIGSNSAWVNYCILEA